MFRNKYSHNKFLAILLITSILFSVFSSVLPVHAVEGEAEASAELGAADTGLTVEPLVLSADDVPEVIDFAEAQEKGHVLRLRSKECDDNTVVFLNDDNTETMYVFAEPVKYTDEYGNIKDKSTALTLSDGAYTMAQNDVEVTFESDIANGVSISRGDVNITMTPVPTTVNSGSLSTTETVTLGTLSNNRMSYANVFDTAELVYTPLYSGFKEDIVLESYNGVSEFSFIVNTNGLTPVKQENGAVWFYDLTTDELAAKMMQVVCYDSAFNFAEGDVRITEIKANQIYGFTVVADAAFLADEDTVYPVYVDPTITLDDATAIEDTVVYSGKPTRNYGDYNYLNVGYVDSSYGRGTMMVRFPTLANNSTFASLTGDDIDSATLSMFTASGGSGTELLYLYIGSIDWTESTATYNSIANIPAPMQFGQVTVPSNGGVGMQINMTSVVKQWTQGNSYPSPNKGIFVTNSNSIDSNQCRDFLSVEYALSSSSREEYMPNLVINYGTTNSVTIAFVDDDDANNGKIDVEKGTSRNFTVDLIYNSRSIRANSLLTFESLDTTIARVPNVNAATVIGVSVGGAGIRVRYTGVPSAVANIPVNVWQEKIIFSKTSYTINNDDYSNSNTGRTCYITAYRKRNTTTLAAHSGITYSIESVDLLDGNTHYSKNNTEAWNMSISSTGKLSYTIPNKDRLNTGLVSHPVGKIVIKATSAKASATVTVKVVCNDISVDDIDPSESLRKDGRYIRIAYPVGSIGATLLEAQYTSFSTMLQSNWSNPDIERIDENFTENAYGQKVSDDIDFFDYIATSKFVVLMSHGTDSGEFIVNANNTTLTISTSDILNLHQGYFKNCELILIYACDGAEGALDSLACSLADRGAKRVFGFKNAVDRYVVRDFELAFYQESTPGLAIDSYDSVEALYKSALNTAYNNEDIDFSDGPDIIASDGETVIKRIEYLNEVMIVGTHIEEFIFD